ncbi:EpsG family protein [Enterococcus casseliflavus]|uniref:EpsG family protein n=1 Tax=Enterococcus casseliflavus TaxID=37734 RepID=UPI001AD62C8D|nr:EpsG family protein [Enterococcus casseliflavus]MBO6383966.1 EpsG family protein [Enterococcus casseliflavus]
MIYFGVFFLSSILCILGDFFKKNKFLYIALFLYFSAVLLVSFFAAIRDYGIGTDMTVYGTRWFQNSSIYYDFSKYMNSISWEGAEIGYAYLNYLISRFTNNSNIFYFILSFITNGLVMLALYEFRARFSISLAWLSYLLIFYGYTFNLLRQGLAMAIVLYGITLFLNNKPKLGLLFLGGAFLFHESAIFILILISGLYFLVIKSKNISKTILFIFAIGVFILVFFNQLINIIWKLGLLSEKYYAYVLGSESLEGITFFGLILKLPIILLFTWLYNSIVKKDKNLTFLFVMIIFDYIFFQLRIISPVFLRISYYFWILQVISVPYILEKVSIKFDKFILIVIYLIYIIFVFWYYIIYLKYNAIYPFTSQFMGI